MICPERGDLGRSVGATGNRIPELAGSSGCLRQGGWLPGVLLAGADPVKQPGQVFGGEFPVEWPGGEVVAVHEGQQGMAEGAGAGEVVGREDFLLDDGEDDLVG